MFYNFAKALVTFFYIVVFWFKATGRENVPKKGGFIVCSNHKSNWDPPTIGVGIDRQLGFMAKEELFRIPVFKNLIKTFNAFPIRRGAGDFGSVKTAIRILKSGMPVTIFPEGRRQKKRMPRTRASGGAIKIAILAGVPILPVGIGGEYRLFGKVRLNIGEPIDYAKYKDSLDDEKLQALADELMEKIYELANK